MPELELSADFAKQAPPHRVYTKEFWGDDWEEIDYLYCLIVVHTLNPSLPYAVFDWRYGVGIQAPGNDALAVVLPEDLLGHYVRLEIDREDDTISTWHGYIVDLIDSRQGARLWPPGGGGERVLSGSQQYVAYGLENFLERTFLRTSIVHDHTVTPWDEYEIKRAIAFNEPLTHKLPAAGENLNRNRSQIKGDEDAYIFTDDPDNADTWSTKDIVEYLLAYHAPKDQNGDAMIEWQLAGSSVLPDWDRPERDFHGRSLKSILDELIDRRRALGWWVALEDEDRDASSPKLIVHICSFTDVVVSMPGGGSLQPNPEIIDPCDFDLALDVELAPLKESNAHEVDQVVVVGERIRSCFSLSFADGTLTEGWTAAQQAAYEAGGDPNNTDLSADQKALQVARKRDELAAVFSHFVLPAHWDGLVKDGVNGEWLAAQGETEEHPFLPEEVNEDLGEADGEERFFRPGMRLLPYLPIKLVRDGTDLGGTVVAGVEYMRPLCLIMTVADDTEPRNKLQDQYQHLERLADTTGLAGEEEGLFTWSASAQVLESDAGMRVEVSGAPQHVLAAGTFTPYENTYGSDPTSVPVDDDPELDYEDNLIVTVFMAADRHVTQHWPRDADLPLTDVVRRVYIELGDRAHLDYVAPGTVLGIDDSGQLSHNLDGGYWIRDDRPMMLDLARLAHLWYNLPRVSLKISYRLTSDPIGIGDYIKTIGAGSTLKTVNCVCTSLAWDLQAGRAEITTDYAELDLAQLVGPAESPDRGNSSSLRSSGSSAGGSMHPTRPEFNASV